MVVEMGSLSTGISHEIGLENTFYCLKNRPSHSYDERFLRSGIFHYNPAWLKIRFATLPGLRTAHDGMCLYFSVRAAKHTIFHRAAANLTSLYIAWILWIGQFASKLEGELRKIAQERCLACRNRKTLMITVQIFLLSENCICDGHKKSMTQFRIYIRIRGVVRLQKSTPRCIT
jgi:hypothetical protein